MFPISLILPEIPPIKIVDVGAMHVGDTPYQALTAAMECRVVGFEPLEEECRKLNAMADARCTFLPYFIGDGSAQVFHECAVPYNSSLLEPELRRLERFTGLAEMMRVVGTSKVQTRRLDDIAEVAGADYLKLDVQGGELMVLEGAVRMLRDTLVVHTEMCFLPLYKNQPLFGDIDRELRSRGFLPHRMPFHGLRPFKPFPVVADPVVSQYVWCDMVYVRDFMTFDALAPEQLLKIAAILHENYNSCDLAALALGAYDAKTGAALQGQYVDYVQTG